MYSEGIEPTLIIMHIETLIMVLVIGVVLFVITIKVAPKWNTPIPKISRISILLFILFL